MGRVRIIHNEAERRERQRLYQARYYDKCCRNLRRNACRKCGEHLGPDIRRRGKLCWSCYLAANRIRNDRARRARGAVEKGPPRDVQVPEGQRWCGTCDSFVDVRYHNGKAHTCILCKRATRLGACSRRDPELFWYVLQRYNERIVRHGIAKLRDIKVPAFRRNYPPEFYTLSSAERYRWQYRNDPVFYKRERERLMRKKSSRNVVCIQGSMQRKDMTRLREQYHKCPRCGLPFAEGSGFSLDHIIPLSRGGTHSLDNVVPLCRKCNTSKHNHIEDWTRWPGPILHEIKRY